MTGGGRAVVGDAAVVDVPGLGLPGHVELVVGVSEESTSGVVGSVGTASGKPVASSRVDPSLVASGDDVWSRADLTGGVSLGSASAGDCFRFCTSRNDRRV